MLLSESRPITLTSSIFSPHPYEPYDSFIVFVKIMPCLNKKQSTWRLSKHLNKNFEKNTFLSKIRVDSLGGAA